MVVEIKSAPSYLDVIPKQKIIKIEKRMVNAVTVNFLVKAYLPDAVIAEAMLDVDDILSDATLEFIILGGWFILLLLYMAEFIFTNKVAFHAGEAGAADGY